MIQRHDFNSEWFGAPVGIVADDAFFDLDADARAQELSPWAWVEARRDLDVASCVRIGRAGFVHVDTQMNFRIGIARIASSPSVESLEARFADDAPFEIAMDELADFQHERFAAIPSVGMESLNRRYALWSKTLLAADPARCMEIVAEGEVQGWFLARRTGKGLGLTLAMLKRDARISGHFLYHRALLAYKERGERVGFASFSVTNTAVLNIYAALGARFLAPLGCWLWRAE